MLDPGDAPKAPNHSDAAAYDVQIDLMQEPA